MAKLHPEEHAAVRAGYEQSAQDRYAIRPRGGSANPHLWSSRMWESFEFGTYLEEKGLPLRDYERGRGNTMRGPDGLTFRLEYGKGKNSFGIVRTS